MDTGGIGDTIGGITAPFIGLLSIWLLIKTLESNQQLNHQSLMNQLIDKLRQDAQNIELYLPKEYLLSVSWKSYQGELAFDYLKKCFEAISWQLNNENYFEYDEEICIYLNNANYHTNDGSIVTGIQPGFRDDFELYGKVCLCGALGITKEIYDKYVKCSKEDKIQAIQRILFNRFPKFKHYYLQAACVYQQLYISGQSFDKTTTQILNRIYWAYTFPSESYLLQQFFNVNGLTKEACEKLNPQKSNKT